MAIDTETKRRSVIGSSLLFLVVLPLADNTIADVDRMHITGLYAGIAPLAVATAIHVFGTNPHLQTPNHATDDDDNVLIMGKIEAQGGAYFGGESNYSEFDSDGNLITSGDITVKGELKGGRCLLGMGEGGTFTIGRYLDFYNGQQSSAYNGYVMARAGSIVGVSCSAIATVVGTTGEWEIQTRINGALSLTNNSGNISSPGNVNWSRTIARGIVGATFVAGDVLTLYMNEQSGDVTMSDVCAMMELQFDT